MSKVYDLIKPEINREPIISSETYLKELEVLEASMNETDRVYPTTGLFFKTKNPNFKKITERNAEEEQNIQQILTMIVFYDNVQKLQGSENSQAFIFPINSMLPLQKTTMATRFKSRNEDINSMEKLTYALNLTATIAYSLGSFTPFSNIGNMIPMGVFYNNRTLITDFYKDIMLMYFKSGEQILRYLRYN